MIRVEAEPGLHLRALVAELPAPLSELPSPAWLTELVQLEASAPVARSEELRRDVRDLLRGHGYRPTGRGKPSSEYLVRAAESGGLSSINLVVDVGNAVSLASGIPISVVDLDRTRGELSVAPAAEGARYVFNRSGQEIDVGGLLCLADAEGPCANAVKDAQRTKTDEDTRRVLVVLWGPAAHAGHVDATATWCFQLFERASARCEAAVQGTRRCGGEPAR